MQQTNDLHDKIFDLLVNSGATPTDATAAVIHVLCNLGVGELELKNEPTLFNVLPDNKPCLSVRSACKRIKINVFVGDDLQSDMVYAEDSPVVRNPEHETNKDLN